MLVVIHEYIHCWYVNFAELPDRQLVYIANKSVGIERTEIYIKARVCMS